MLHRHEHHGTRADVEDVAGAQVPGSHLKVVRIFLPPLLGAPLFLQIVETEAGSGHAQVLGTIHFEEAESMVSKIDGADKTQMDHPQHPLRRAAIVHGEAKWLAFAWLRLVPI